MKVIASYNIKGGVGKTATAVNLSYLAAWEGSPTLVWDLDPQGAASFYFRVKPKVKGGTVRLLKRKRELDDAIKATDYPRLDLIPADFSYRNMDLTLEHFGKSSNRLRKLIKPLRDEYDYLFIDCPPSISLVSENVFQAADILLVPTIPTTLSLRTLYQLLQFCDIRRYRHLSILPFFSMVDPIEDWGLTNLETSLATFILHDDYRDYYERTGWSVFARFRLPYTPIQFKAEYFDEEHDFMPVASPWSITKNGDPWREQPLVAEGDTRFLETSLIIDSRNDPGDPTDGWLIRATARRRPSGMRSGSTLG